MKIIDFHRDIRKFFDSLDMSTASKVTRILELLALKEYQLRMPYSKKISTDLYELRVQNIQNIRIFYTFYNDQIYLLHVINKKTQGLRLKDIETAKTRLKHLYSK